MMNGRKPERAGRSPKAGRVASGVMGSAKRFRLAQTAIVARLSARRAAGNGARGKRLLDRQARASCASVRSQAWLQP